jgi:hypothetical protein
VFVALLLTPMLGCRDYELVGVPGGRTPTVGLRMEISDRSQIGIANAIVKELGERIAAYSETRGDFRLADAADAPNYQVVFRVTDWMPVDVDRQLGLNRDPLATAKERGRLIDSVRAVNGYGQGVPARELVKANVVANLLSNAIAMPLGSCRSPSYTTRRLEGRRRTFMRWKHGTRPRGFLLSRPWWTGRVRCYGAMQIVCRRS